MNESNLTREDHFANALEHFELVIVGIIMISTCVLTVIGNALVLLSFMLDKKLRTLNNYFLLSLALSDFMVATFSMPLFTLYTLEGEWILGPFLCDMWLAQDYLSCSASGLNLLVISFDRYLSVTRPLKYRARRNKKRVLTMISCVWCLSFLIWPPWIYAWPYIEGRRTVPSDECYIQFLETNTYLTIVTSVVSYYIPVTIMCCLYYCIWKETEKRKVYLQDMQSGRFGSDALNINQKVNNRINDHRCFNCCGWWFVKCKSRNVEKNIAFPNDARFIGPTNKISTRKLIVDHEYANTENSRKSKDEVTCESSENSDLIHLNASSKLKESLSRNGSTKQDNKTARTLTAILLAFMMTVTPYNILVIIRNIDGTHSMVPDALWNFFYFTVYVNSTLNPICYSLANKNFRKTYWKILTCSWNKRVPHKSNYSFKELNVSQNKNSISSKNLDSSQ